MPYTMKDAPPRRVLPQAALRLWLDTYNSVFDETGNEDQARQAAWSNVKKAGYRRGEDEKWHKVEAEIADRATFVSTESALDRAAALALPIPTPSKVYAEFKLLSFDKANENQDGFLADDVSDEAVSTLEGSPIYVERDASDHPEKDARATERAQYQVGTVTQAEKREDGIYCVGAFQREYLEDRGIKPSSLAKRFSVSMEVTFDRAKAKYTVGERVLPYREALAAGAAAPVGSPDDRSKYDVRWIPPTEFHAVALLTRGRNADREADVLKVAASDGEDMSYDEIIWALVDQEAYQAYFALNPKEEEAIGAALTTEKRKALPRGQFAYVDEDGKGHLPIHDAAHVRNALARLNQTDIPAGAKRKALRKILAAARRLGVKVDPESPNVKAYSGHMGLEGMIEQVREAFYKQFTAVAPEPMPMIRATYNDYVIAEKGDKTLRIPYSVDGDDVKFGEPEEGEMLFKSAKAAAEETKPAQVAPAADEKAVRAKVEAELRPRIEAEAKAALDKERTKIAKDAAEKAVEDYKNREKQVADRIEELEKIDPISDDEREDLNQKVRDADDLAYANLKNERLQAALEKARTEKGQASKDVVFPPLRGGRPKSGAENPYDVTIN